MGRSRSLDLALIAMLAIAGCGDAAETPGAPQPTASTAAGTPAGPTPAGARPAWTPTTRVGRVVADVPATARIFELIGIDYCCGGDQTLAQAAEAQGLEVDGLLGALSVAHASADRGSGVRWAERPLVELADHIETTHHVFLRRELPRLAGIVATVARVHGKEHPELEEVRATFDALHADLIPHLEHEEKHVFPAIRDSVEPGKDSSLAQALDQMRAEHDVAGAAIHKLRALTNGYRPPEDACTLYEEMLRGLAALEKDTLVHVHLENNVLLPRLRGD